MHKLLLLLILLPPYSFGADQVDCEKAVTTVNVSVCKTREASDAFADLEIYLDKAKERFASEKTVIDSINRSQEAWLAYSRAHCDSVYEMYGTIRYTMRSACHLRLTKKRTHVIWKDYLTYADSTEPLLPEPKQ